MYYGYNAKRIKESLETSDVIKVLESFHADYRTLDNGDATLAFNAICHSQMNTSDFKPETHNLIYYAKTKTFCCFSGCGRKSYDIFTLVQQIFLVQFGEELSFGKAVEYVGDLLECDKTEILESGFSSANPNDFRMMPNTEGWGWVYGSATQGKKIMQEEREAEIQKLQYDETKEFLEHGKLPQIPPLNNILLTMYEPLHLMKYYAPIWLNDGISLETMERFNIMFDNYYKEIIIPHFDINNNLIGIRSRVLKTDEIAKYGKYRPTFYNGEIFSHPTSQNLFGLNMNKDNIKRFKKIVLVEAEKSVLQLDTQLEHKNNISAAVCGSFVSNEQLKLIKDLGVEEVILAFDKEFIQPPTGTVLSPENYKYMIKYELYLDKLHRIICKIGRFFDLRVISDSINTPMLEYKDSPTDKGFDIFMTLYKHAMLYRPSDF